VIVKGQKINDRYQIVRNIGEGGMANVYLAVDTILDRKVAIKILRGDLADDPKFVRRFQREALSASSLSHPNIVEMYDVGQDTSDEDEKYYIVMEYIEGKTLKQLIKKRGALTISEVIDIMMQLASGLAHAHEAYIIHRDIKPQNIMILEDGGVKITDFGIAMALNGTQLTQTNSVMGSVHYLPPEQANGTGSTIKSDIYSLGIMMYELLTGKLPYKGDNAVEIALKHMKEEISSVRKTNASIPQSVENIIIKSTAKNPKNRYEDAQEMVDDLKTCLDGSRLNEPKYKYKYPEFSEEDSKNKKKKEKKGISVEKISVPIDSPKKKKNKLIILLSSILVLIGLGIGFIAIIFPKISEVPDIIVPDVTNLTVVEAEKVLKDIGFDVAIETKKLNSEEIEEGKIIKTEPQKGRSVKKGTEVTMYESLGIKKLLLEDYTGKNYLEVKNKIELEYDIYVLVEPEETTDEEIEEGEILRQDPEKGTTLLKNETLTLYVANLVDEYPDMIAMETDVQLFAEDYNINVTYSYQETDEYDAGRVIYQSRTPESKIVNGSTLRVTIALKPDTIEPNVVEDTEEPVNE